MRRSCYKSLFIAIQCYRAIGTPDESLIQFSHAIKSLSKSFTQETIIDTKALFGIPVTQLSVFDQKNGGGDASCGYQALKNVAAVLAGLATNRSFTAELVDPKLPNKLFALPTKDAVETGFSTELSPWRAFIIYQKNIPAALALILQNSISKEKLFKPLNDIVDDFQVGNDLLLSFFYETVQKYIGNYKKPMLLESYAKYSFDQNFKSSWDFEFDTKTISAILHDGARFWFVESQPMGEIDGVNVRTIIDSNCCTEERIKKYVLPDINIKLTIDFSKPLAIIKQYTNVRDTLLTSRIAEQYENLSTDQKKIIDDYIKERGGSLRNAFNMKLTPLYNAIDQEIAQPLDLLGDWLNEKNINDLVPLVYQNFPEISLNTSLIAIENITNKGQQKKLVQLLKKLNNKDSGAIGVILGGQGGAIESRHWIGLVIVKEHDNYKIIVLDSLNANRLEPNDNVASQIFYERINTVAELVNQNGQEA